MNDDGRGPNGPCATNEWPRVERDVAIPMAGGVFLRADIFRPAEDGLFPVLLTFDGAGEAAQADAESWAAEGYVCVRVKPRDGEPAAKHRTQDAVATIDWAAHQPWSNGRVGLGGLADDPADVWKIAAAQPRNLAAVCAWEAAADPSREVFRHGGIPVAAPAATGHVVEGGTADGPPDWDKITAPLLSAANWGGHGLHTRGNFDGFALAASREKWLEAHGGAAGEHFHSEAGRALRRKFFDHFLKGEDTGWDEQPRVLLNIRHPNRFEQRAEAAWPIPRTVGTRCYLDLDQDIMSPDVTNHTGTRAFEAMGDGLTFLTEPLSGATELAGPMAVKLYVSSTTEDADIFVVLRVFTPDLREITFDGAADPHMPVAQGWLRASHRKLDRRRTLPHRPYHTHDDPRPLAPGEIAELDIEIWPTSIAIPAGCRIGLSIRGRDYEHAAGGGCAGARHDDPFHRPPEIFAGITTLHVDDGHRPFLLLAVIQPKR